jgi:hypothetical protein
LNTATTANAGAKNANAFVKGVEVMKLANLSPLKKSQRLIPVLTSMLKKKSKKRFL